MRSTACAQMCFAWGILSFFVSLYSILLDASNINLPPSRNLDSPIGRKATVRRMSRTPRIAVLLGTSILLLGIRPGRAQLQQKQEVPDAPSATRPIQPFPSTPPANAPSMPPPNQPPPQGDSSAGPSGSPAAGEGTASPVPDANAAANSNQAGGAAQGELYRIVRNVNQVLIPVMVKDEDGRMVGGLLPKDFTVREGGTSQKLNFFSVDPFPLSAAVLLDLGLPDVAIQKINKTFPSLQGAFSQF